MPTFSERISFMQQIEWLECRTLLDRRCLLARTRLETLLTALLLPVISAERRDSNKQQQ
jgi:hypothetical protein